MFRLLPIFLATLLTVAAAPADEIEALLHFVGNLQGASFVRNGTAYPAAAAESHLRLKWSKQQDDIKTAEDFIRLCGTKSSMSNQPYLIRYADGREIPAATVLTTQLEVIRSQKRSSAAPPGKSR